MAGPYRPQPPLQVCSQGYLGVRGTGRVATAKDPRHGLHSPHADSARAAFTSNAAGNTLTIAQTHSHLCHRMRFHPARRRRRRGSTPLGGGQNRDNSGSVGHSPRTPLPRGTHLSPSASLRAYPQEGTLHRAGEGAGVRGGAEQGPAAEKRAGPRRPRAPLRTGRTSIGPAVTQ